MYELSELKIGKLFFAGKSSAWGLLLGEVDREGTILVWRPLKVGAQKPVHSAHELDLELRGQQSLEPSLNRWVL